MQTQDSTPNIPIAVVPDEPPRPSMNHHSVHNKTEGESQKADPLNVRLVRRIAWGATCVASFMVGYLVSDRRLERLARDSGRQQVQEFVQFCDHLGILDRQRLEEAIIIASEAEWEDRDAEQQTEGGNR